MAGPGGPSPSLRTSKHSSVWYSAGALLQVHTATAVHRLDLQPMRRFQHLCILEWCVHLQGGLHERASGVCGTQSCCELAPELLALWGAPCPAFPFQLLSDDSTLLPSALVDLFAFIEVGIGDTSVVRDCERAAAKHPPYSEWWDTLGQHWAT